MLHPEWLSSASKSQKLTPEFSSIRYTSRRTKDRIARLASCVVHCIVDPRDLLTSAVVRERERPNRLCR